MFFFSFLTDEVLSDNIRASRIERDLEGKSLHKCLCANKCNRDTFATPESHRYTQTRIALKIVLFPVASDKNIYLYILDLTILCQV